MIIGIDLHGVIDDDPDRFKDICIGFTCWECCVYIISGPPEDEIEKELKKHKIYRDKHFGAILSVVDHLKEKGAKMWQDDRDRWWASDEEWWRSKAELCEKHNVDILIDDKEEWGEHFKNIKTKFLLYGG